jgi:hypothetical protein
MFRTSGLAWPFSHGYSCASNFIRCHDSPKISPFVPTVLFLRASLGGNCRTLPKSLSLAI